MKASMKNTLAKESHSKSSLFRILHWIDDQLLLLIGLLLFIVIAFLPKIPLADIIPGYIVRVRGEDFLVVFSLIVFGIQLLRKKATLNTPVTKLWVYYGIIGVLVMLNAMFLVRTLPLNFLHVGKMFLHFARRIEYFSLFFILFSAIKKRWHIAAVLAVIVFIVFGISIYGYGQKYFYWPVYSTMNREFSKGVRLVLTQYARVPSTFGGQYDMSAYLVIALTLLFAIGFVVKQWYIKVPVYLVTAMGFWLLILGASRSSFGGYILSVSVLIVMLGLIKKSIPWTISRGFIVLGLSLFVMISFGDLYSRFSDFGVFKQLNVTFAQLLHPAVAKPNNSVEVTPLDKTDELPLPAVTVVTTPAVTPAPTRKPTKVIAKVKSTPVPAQTVVLPPDVYVNVPDLKVITATVGGKTVQETIQVPRTYSDCTYKYGLSACIRFDTTWPRAIAGFLRNPLLGSGYSTLTKATRDEFTEAESTDNDFFRNLGESGILGVIGFYGAIALFIVAVLKRFEDLQNNLVTALVLGLIAGTLGLFLNGIYIDVFEASKVAFAYWALMGVAFASLAMVKKGTSHDNNGKKDLKE